MIERIFSRLLVVVVFGLVVFEAIDTWWDEYHHHRHCARSWEGQ